MWPVAVGAIVIAALGLMAAPALRRPAAPPEIVRFGLLAPRGVNFVGSTSSISVLQFAVSPDGRHLVFVGGRPGAEPALWLRAMTDVGQRELTGSTGATDPFWSPDGLMVGFFAGGRLKTIHIGTGEVRDICPASRAPRGGTWNRDGVIIFGGDSGSGLSKVSVSTGLVEVATQGTEESTSHRWPWFLPDGRRFLFYARGEPTIVACIWDRWTARHPCASWTHSSTASTRTGFCSQCETARCWPIRSIIKPRAITGDPSQDRRSPLAAPAHNGPHFRYRQQASSSIPAAPMRSAA